MQPALKTGTLKKKLDGGDTQQQEYVMTFLGEEHLPQIMGLQKIIAQNLSRPDLLEVFPYDFMKEHIGRQGFILGIFVDHRLIAFRNVYFPDSRDKEWNLGIDIGLAEVQRTKVANFQMVCVHPSFRGNALASKMNRISLRLLREQATHEHVCATVSPYNIWNIRILLNNGFRIMRLKKKYSGKIRYVVYQNLRTPLEFNDDNAVYARLDDLDTQKEIFHSGRYGVALAQEQNFDRVSQKELASCCNIIFKKPSDQQVVHVVTGKPQSIETSQAITADLWIPEKLPAVHWDIAGDPTVTVSSSQKLSGPIQIGRDITRSSFKT